MVKYSRAICISVRAMIKRPTQHNTNIWIPIIISSYMDGLFMLAFASQIRWKLYDVYRFLYHDQFNRLEKNLCPNFAVIVRDVRDV